MEKEEEEGKEGDGGRRKECLFEVKTSSAKIEGEGRVLSEADRAANEKSTSSELFQISQRL